MKKTIFVIVATTLLISSLYSQTFSIVSGWQNLGAINDINVTKTFSNNCIDMVWKYDDTSNSWSAYSPKNTLRSIIDNSNDISLLTNIDNGSGFWVKANSDCSIFDNSSDINIINDKINIVSGWQNLGAKSDINVSSVLNKPFVNIVWKYNNNSNSWSAYSPKSSIQNILNSNGISFLDVISKGSGFWLKTSSKCILDANQTVDYDPSYDPINQTLSNPGKYPGMFSNDHAFAALKNDGSVVTWGNTGWGGDSGSVADKLKSGVKAIYSTKQAFAALKDDGSVVTWGHNEGTTVDFSSVADKLSSGVKVIYSTMKAFAALKNDGSVVTWGNGNWGGDNSWVADKLCSGVKAIYSTIGAFAALKNDGSVVTWGLNFDGKDFSSVADKLSSGVKAIYSTQNAFAALKNDGSVVTWGYNQSGGDGKIYGRDGSVIGNVSDKLKSGVKIIYSNSSAFAALKNDGSVVTWGNSQSGGEMSVVDWSTNEFVVKNVADKLKSGVKIIYSNGSAFAALKNDGSVVTWGERHDGGDMAIVNLDGSTIENVANKLSSDVKAIYSNGCCFAALKEDGSVVTWGRFNTGGRMAIFDENNNIVKDISSKLSSGVKTIYSNANTFAALKNDGSVVTWGSNDDGGDSSSVADKLSSGVKTIYSNANAFAALKNDGSVVTWGVSKDGGEPVVKNDFDNIVLNVADKLKSGVIALSKSY